MGIFKRLRTQLFILLFFFATALADECFENECRFTLTWNQQQQQLQQQQQQHYNQWNFSNINDRANITKVTFEPMIFTRLPTNILEAFTNLTTFDASHQNMSSIDARVFGGNSTDKIIHSEPSKMYAIDFSINKIQSIPTNAFAKVPNLRTLDLSQNNIQEIKNGAFWKLGNLKNLKLNNNKLTTVGNTTFQYLHSVRHIDLNNNQLQIVNLDDFAANSGLTSVFLHSNNLTRVDANQLGQALELIDLSKNDIEIIARDGSFGNVRTLNLTGNPRLKLDKADFKRMKAFVNLYLLDTEVEILNWASIPKFPLLKSLSLKSINVNDTNSVKSKFPKLQSLLTTENIWNCNNSMDLLSCSDNTGQQQDGDTYIGLATGQFRPITELYVIFVLLTIVAILVLAYFVVKSKQERETTVDVAKDEKRINEPVVPEVVITEPVENDAEPIDKTTTTPPTNENNESTV